MLHEIRERSSGIFAWVIAALIIIPMAFFGVQGYVSTDANPLVLEVGDTKITKGEYDQRLRAEQQQMRQRLGESANDDFLFSDGFKKSVLNRMVSRAMLEQIAENENYRVSDEQLAREIKESELFKLDGEFSQEAYERFLIGSRYSKQRYEEEFRRSLMSSQVTDGYEESALVLPDEVRLLLDAQAEQRSFDIVTVKKADFVEAAEIEESEIETFYNENTDRYMQPEMMSVDYLELNRNELAKEIEIDEEEIKAIFEQNADSYKTSAKRETRHILLSTTDGKGDDEQLAKANELIAQLKGGADFSELAKEHSDDAGSGSRGGALGLVEKGQMVKPFEDATFALEKDEISEAVKSQFGYHIIQVTDIQEPKAKTFEEVKAELLSTEREQRAENLLLEQRDILRDLVYEQPDNLEAAAEQLGLEIQTSELFSRAGGSGIASAQAVRNAAFSEEVMVEELNSEPLEASPESVVVIRKNTVQEASARPLTEVKAQVESVLKDEKARESAKLRAEELLAVAQESWSTITEDETLELASHTLSLIDPNRVVPGEVIEQVVGMKIKDGSDAIEMVTTRAGDTHIVRLTKVEEGNIDEIDEQIKETTRQALAQRNGASLFDDYLDTIRQEHQTAIDTADL